MQHESPLGSVKIDILGPASTSFRSQTHFRKRGKGPVDTSFTSQTHFCKRGKGLVNCINKLCPTGMQLAR